MRKVNFLKISLKCGFLYSNILNSNAMEDKNMALLKAGAINNEIKETKEINIKEETTEENTTEESSVTKSLKTIIEAGKKMNTNFLDYFKDIINEKYYKYINDSFYKRKRTGSIIPNDSKKLIEENEKLYNELNTIFAGNFFTDFKFNNILDQYIKLNSIYDYVNNLPSIKNLWNIYGKQGYSLELTNMYKYITSLNKKNIDNFSNIYNSKRGSGKLNEHSKTNGNTWLRKGFINIKITDVYLDNFKKDYYRDNLSGKSLARNFNKQFLNEIYGNKGTVTHELNHFNNDIIKILSDKENSDETESFTAIESDIHKIIIHYCNEYYNKNNKLFSSSNISEILDFINILKVESLKTILNKYDKKIYNNKAENVDYSKKLNRIKEFLNFGSGEQQCKLLEILSYVGNVLIKHDNNEVKDNLSKYSTKKICEMSADCSSFSLLAKDEYNEYSKILFAFEYSYITNFLKKQKIINSNNINILDFKFLKKDTRKIVKEIKNYNEYILYILKSIKTENCLENKVTINLNISERNEKKYNELYFGKKFYKYLILTLTKEEEENLRKSDDKSINELLKEYKKKIKYTDFLEDCYVDNIMNESLDLKTYFFELKYEGKNEIVQDDELNDESDNNSDNESDDDSDDDSDDESDNNSDNEKCCFIKEIKFKVKKISESEIKTTVDKIKKLMEDFYKYLFKKNDKNLEKLNTLDKVQLICIFHRILNDNNDESNKNSNKENFHKYECNTLDSIVINNILNNIIYLNYEKVGDVINGEIKDVKVKELNIKLEKNKHIDDRKVILYINKDYLENIKKGIFEEFSSNDNIFGICKSFDNDRDSKKCNYYFYKSNFVKNDLSGVKKKKENINETYELFNEKYEKIIEIFKDFDGDYLLDDLYHKYCKNYKNSDDLDEMEDENNANSFNKKNSDDSEDEYLDEEIIENTTIDTSDIKDLLDNISNYKKMINEEIEEIKENYTKLCKSYDNIIILLPFQFEKFENLKNEFLKKYEELNKELEEINKKMNKFNNLFKESNDNIKRFIKKNIKKIYDNMPREYKKDENFIKFFNKKYGTHYETEIQESESEYESESGED